jgi:peroxiredoxin
VKKLHVRAEESRAASPALTTLNILLRAAGTGLTGWIGYQLIRQNGQVLLRLDAIQERLDTLDPTQPVPSQPAGLAMGLEAPTFELPDLSGHLISLESLQGSPLLLMFFDPGCGFCRTMAPDLAKLPIDGKNGQPVPVVVTAGDVDANRKLIEEHGIQCTVLVQSGREVAAAYGTNGTPSGYLIDESGRIASQLKAGAPELLELARDPAKAKQIRSEQGANMCGGTGGTVRTYRGVEDSHLIRTGLPAGTPAPEFRLPNLAGGELTLEQYRGRRVLLVFSDPNCGPCDQLAPQLEQLQRTASGLQVVMISRGDPEANRQKVKELRLTFPVALQKQWEMSRAYGMFATPIAYLIDEHGTIAADVATGPEGILRLVSSAAARQLEVARA